MRLVSDQAVEVNGIPCHIKHVHRCASSASADEDLSAGDEDEELNIQLPTRVVEEDLKDAAEAITLPRHSSRLRTPRICDVCLE